MPYMPHMIAAPKVFGWQHIVYLAVFLVLAAGSLAFVKLKVKDEKIINIIIKCAGGLLLVFIVWNRITLAFRYESAFWLIPNSFCGTTSLIFAICAIFCKRDKLVFHYLIYSAFWGGIIVSVYPDFIGQAEYFMYQPTISGLLHHTFGAYLAVLMVITGFVKPCLKKYYSFPLGFCIIMVYGIFLLDCFGGYINEAMYIFKPLVPNTILTWYFVGPLLVLGNLGFVALWEKIIKPKLDEKKSKEVKKETDG